MAETQDESLSAFKLVLQERDAFKAEVEMLRAELVRRDNANEFALAKHGQIQLGRLSVPVELLEYDTDERYRVFSNALAQAFVLRIAGQLSPRNRRDTCTYISRYDYNFNLTYIIPP